MTKQEKQLLLIDLCSRLPYGVKVKIKNIIQPQRLHWSYISDEKDWDLPKPYLRPMSSMTEEERDVVHNLLDCFNPKNEMWMLTNFLDKRMLDHRHLIEKGLALEATEGMYK